MNTTDSPYRQAVDLAVHRLLPALIFPSVYREFLRQECDAAGGADTSEGRELLARIGWSESFYRNALSDDDLVIDGAYGPQQMLLREQLALNRQFEVPLGRIRVDLMTGVIDVLGVPKGQIDRGMQHRLRAEANELLRGPIDPDEAGMQRIVRALATLTAAKLGIDPPWKAGGTTSLAISSPNSGSSSWRHDGTLVEEVKSRHDLSDLPAFAADLLARMCWLPVFGGTHVPVISQVMQACDVYLRDNSHLHDRAEAVLSSMLAIQLQWDHSDIEQIEQAMKGRRVPYLKNGFESQVSLLAQFCRSGSLEAPVGGLRTTHIQQVVLAGLAHVREEMQLPPDEAAKLILKQRLVESDMLGVDWSDVIDRHVPAQGSQLKQDVEREINNPAGVAVQPIVESAIEAEGLPGFHRLPPPKWRATLCPEARRCMAEAEQAFGDRLRWTPTPRSPEAPESWASVLWQYARVVEAELLYRYMDPILDEVAQDQSSFSDDRLRTIKPGSPGSPLAKMILRRRRDDSSTRGSRPTLGQIHFVLDWRAPHSTHDAGRHLLNTMHSTLARQNWLLVISRNVGVLKQINHWGRHRHEQATPVTRDTALLSRRVIMHYLHGVVLSDQQAAEDSAHLNRG